MWRTGAPALFAFAATARIHGSDEDALRRESDGAFDASHGDRPVFQRLAQSLDDVAVEFGEFIHEKHAAVSQGLSLPDAAWSLLQGWICLKPYGAVPGKAAE